MGENVIAKNYGGKTRNGEIDLLRFLFSITVLLHHFGTMLPKKIAVHGNIAVEFFFVVAGVFMARHAKKIVDSGKPDSIGNATWKYIIYKCRSFYAYYLIAVVLSAVFFKSISEGIGVFGLAKGLVKSIPTFTLTVLGLNSNYLSLYVPNTWFLSGLLIASFILFPIMLRNFDVSTKIIFPLLTLFTLGWLYAGDKTIIYTWYDWAGFTYHGLVRAIAEMAMGAAAFSLIDWIRNRENNYSKLLKLMFTAVKWGSFLLVFLYAFSTQFKVDYSIHALLFCCLGVVLSLSDISYNIPATKVSGYLGKCALPIFLFHGFVKYILENNIEAGQLKMTPTLFVVASVATVIGSVILMHGTDYVVKLIRSRKRRTPAAETGTEKE